MVSRKKEKAQLTRPARFITKEITEDEIPYQLPKSWKWVRLYDICSLVTDVNHKMPRAVVDGVKFISAKDLVSGGRINLENDVKRISEEDFAQLGKRVIPQRGDIIYSRIGTIGKSRIVKTDERFMVSYSLCVIRPSNVNANYLNYYLDSGIVLEQAKKEARSIGVPDLGMQSIKNFLVALPPPA